MDRLIPSIARVRSLAKKMAKTTGRSHISCLEYISKKYGFKTYECFKQRHGFQQRALGKFAPCIRLPIETSNEICRLRIGNCYWSMCIGRCGPQLFWSKTSEKSCHLVHAVDLGLAPQICKPGVLAQRAEHQDSAAGWVLTKYGSYPVVPFGCLNEEEANTLSREFGIPLSTEFRGDGSRIREQQRECEKRFLTSPAFVELRQALRKGRMKFPSLLDWISGLTPAWAHLVVMSDRDFKHAKEFVDKYFHPNNGPRMADLNNKLAEFWGNVPSLQPGAGLEYGFCEVIQGLKGKLKHAARNKGACSLRAAVALQIGEGA